MSGFILFQQSSLAYIEVFASCFHCLPVPPGKASWPVSVALCLLTSSCWVFPFQGSLLHSAFPMVLKRFMVP